MGGGHHERELAQPRDYYAKYERIGTGFWGGELIRDIYWCYFSGLYGTFGEHNRRNIQHPNSMRVVDKGLGIPGEERPVRVKKVSLEDLMHQRGMINMETKRHSYCMHHHLAWLRCTRTNGRNRDLCAHEEHEWAGCQNKDEYLRSMETERVRRLHALGLVPDARNHDNKYNTAASKNPWSVKINGGFPDSA